MFDDDRTIHPLNRRAWRRSGEVWNADELPVTMWEAAEHRVVLPAHLQDALQLDEPVLRWPAAKQSRLELERGRDNAILSSLSTWLDLWHFAGREVGEPHQWRVLFFSHDRWFAVTIGYDQRRNLNVITVVGGKAASFLRNRLRGMTDVIERK